MLDNFVEVRFHTFHTLTASWLDNKITNSYRLASYLDHVQHARAPPLAAPDLLDGQIQLPVLAVAVKRGMYYCKSGRRVDGEIELCGSK